MDYFAKRRIFDRLEQFLLKDLAARQDLKPGKVTLKLETPVDRHEHVKFILGDCEERSVLQGIPALLVNGERHCGRQISA